MLTRELMIIQRDAGRLAIAENPWSSLAWGLDMLMDLVGDGYELVRGDGCLFGLWSWLDEKLMNQSTGYLIPAGSAIEEYVNRLRWWTRACSCAVLRDGQRGWSL